MCRQTLFNKAGFDLIEKEYGGMKIYLDFLVKERGGNGNGLALIKDGKIVKFNKGLDYTTEDIMNDLKHTDYDWALFHSRLATIGNVNNVNTHPFVLDCDTCVSMNGTEKKYEEECIYDRSGNMTDAERVIAEFGRSNVDPEKFFIGTGLDSVYLGFFKGKPFVASNYYPNLRFLTRDNAIVFGSDFPVEYDGINIYDTTSDDFYWEEGRVILSDSYVPAYSGKLCIVDCLVRQLLNKTFDTLITILSQKTGILEEEFNTDRYTVDDIVRMCLELNIIDNKKLVLKK